jgi:hypothetical protein
VASAYEVIRREEHAGLLRVRGIDKTVVTTWALKKVTFVIDEGKEVRLSALRCISECCELSQRQAAAVVGIAIKVKKDEAVKEDMLPGPRAG